jgi:hypothetical protein
MRAQLSATTRRALLVSLTIGTIPLLASAGTAATSRPAAVAGSSDAGPSAPAAPQSSGTSSFAGSGLLAPDSKKLFHVSGCLTEPKEKLSQVPRSSTRALKPSRVRFTRAKGLLTIVHSFTHACCLRLDLTQATKNGTLTVHERLFGKPCRCMCGSEIEIPVSQVPEPISVTIETEWPAGNSRVVFAGPPRSE